MLTNPNSPHSRAYADNAQTASRSANVKFSIVDVGRPDDLKHVFATVAEQKSGAVILSADGMLYNKRKQVADLTIAHRLPTIGVAREMAEAGLLLSYGSQFSDLFRRAGVYIDKILKGTKPADLPIELPTKFVLVVIFDCTRAWGDNT